MMDLHDIAGPDSWRWRVRPPPWPPVKIFCEGTHDIVLFERLVGATLGRLVEFVGPPGPPEGGAGWAVRMMRDARRDKPEPIEGNLHRAYALLDGEQRLRSHAKYCYLLRGDDLRREDRIVHAEARDDCYYEPHQVDIYGDTEGILFLNAHEQESLYYLYGDVWEQLKAGWKETRQLFGEDVGADDLWRILARAAAYTLLTSVVKRYDLNAKDVMSASNLLKQRGHRTHDLVEAALKLLKPNMLERGIPNRVVAREFAEIRHAVSIMDERIDLYPHLRFRMLRFCDPKAWFAIANLSQRIHWGEARAKVLESSLSGRFQADLIHQLLGDPRPNHDCTRYDVGGGRFGLTTRPPRT